LPDLELCLDIDWQCKKQTSSTKPPFPTASTQQTTTTYHQANYHNHCQPCSPDKIPLVVNSFEHDSFSHFRSESVNLSFSFICNSSNSLSSSKMSSDQMATCKFYASTSRFLERIKLLLSTITRPTKRGKLFGNLKPRKPILSRHFNLVRFHFDVPSLKCIYWSSASEQYGVQVDCEQLKLSSTLRLELTPFHDTLKRRPRPNWFADMMQVKTEQLNFYLMSPDPIRLDFCSLFYNFIYF
jgi:hypothetical protein